MTEQEARGFLAASGDNGVLAAWAAVCHEYSVNAQYDVSPYDVWDAYQELFTLGAISPTAFDNTDVKLAFFSGRRPSNGEVQSVLDNYNIPRGSIPMSNLGNPFGNKKAIATRDTQQVSSQREAIPLGGSTKLMGSPQLSQQSIAPRQEISGPPMQHGGPSLGSPMPNNSLGAPTRPQIDVPGIDGYKPQTWECRCGYDLLKIVKVAGGQGLIDDESPQGDVQVIDAMFTAICPDCGLIWHTSCGAVTEHGQFR